MKPSLANKRVAVLATHGVEPSELSRPMAAARDAGARVELVSPTKGSIRSFSGLDEKETFDVDVLLRDASAEDYDALILPGGVANPDALRQSAEACAFVRHFFETGKPVAAICHAPWLLIDAGVVKGRTVTSWPSLRSDLENAGANWVDSEVEVDRGLVTSRKPDDLDAFCAKLLEEVAEGRHARSNAK
jgi:protease I